MPSEKIELPPLPEFHGWIGANDIDPDAGVEGYTADDMRAYALLAVKQERARIDASEVVQFLYGAGDLDGVGFSEVPVGKPRYWWRSVLRATLGKES